MSHVRSPEKGARVMRDRGMKWRGRLTVVTLAWTALLVAACSSTAPAASPRSPAQASAADVAPVEIQSLELRAGEPEVHLEVAADAPLMWTSFRDPEGRLIIELPNTVTGGGVADLFPDAGLVSAIRVETPTRDGGPMTRLVVATRQAVEHSVSGEGQRLAIELTPVGDVVAVASVPGTTPAATSDRMADEIAYEPLPADEPMLEDGVAMGDDEMDVAVSDEPAYDEPAYDEPAYDEPAYADEPATLAAAYPMDAGTPEDPFVGPPPTGSPARRVDDLAVETTSHGTVVRVRGDGQFDYSTFALDNPHRFVIDLAGVVSGNAPPSVAVGGLVQRVRLGQFRSAPDPVSRVVFDLELPMVPRIERTSDTLVVDFGELNGNSPVARHSAAATLPADTTTVAEPSLESRTVVASYQAPADPSPRLSPQGETQLEVTNNPQDPARDEVEIQVEPVEQVPRPERAMPERSMPERSTPQPTVREPVSRRTPPSMMPDNDAIYGRENVEISTPSLEEDDPFSARTLGAGNREYVGERLDFSLRDADLVETLRSFAVMSGLNIVIQPGVGGTVTVELQDVPWDQAFEQILKLHNLSYEVEGNIMRIAPVQTLQAEAQQRQELAQAKALSIPLTTVIRRLSYSQAGNVASILSSQGGLLSQRGTVIVDDRTNTLIIKELPEFIDTVIAVIENLDIPEPLVMIEARIVETRKNFTRTLGIDWGFTGVASPATGNTTGLVFPNQGTVSGGVDLLTGGQNGLINLMLGNVLNTFNLDATLQAAENEGLVNILSAPKVQALNNQQASIQSGVQIPIQTVANNTVSVQFVNATLRLDVTPQVTAEGTVMMDINIQKRNPEFGLTVAGATNAPISTKEARTRVIVRDGGTTVIGGIYEVSTNQGEDRVPGLANVPIIGHLFKNRRRSDENSELLIFITPRVIKL